MKYIIDSNCFITPHRGYCPTDVAVSFWNKLHILAADGRICSLDKVKDELFFNEDDLKHWLEGNVNENFFLRFEGAAIVKFGEVARWANRILPIRRMPKGSLWMQQEQTFILFRLQP